MKHGKLEEQFEQYVEADLEAREATRRMHTAKYALTQHVLDAGLHDCLTLNVDKLARRLQVRPPRHR